METSISRLPAVETIENGENVNIVKKLSTTSPNLAVLDVPAPIKQETDGISNHALVAESLEMPPEDPGDIEGTDEEDILEIYDGHPSKPGDDVSVQAPASTRVDRPDFSSTSEDEMEDINFKEPKLLLQSDVSRSSSYKFPSKSRMIRNSVDDEHDEPTARYADPRIYMRCIPCIRGHKTCNRRLPYCQRCRSPSECFYPRNSDYNTNFDALDAYDNLDPETSQKRSASESAVSAAKRSSDPVSIQILKSITWQGGDISHSQKRCPSPVIKQIREHKREFEDTQLAGLWPKDKTVHSDLGRDAVYVDEQMNEDIPVARYIYKDAKQFFVAWLPAQDTSQPSLPVVCKFRVYNNEPALKRNGRNWMPLRWSIWCPNNELYHRRDIIRLVATSQYKPSTTIRSPEILDLDTNFRNGHDRRLSNRVDDADLIGDYTDDQERARPTKKLKSGSAEPWRGRPSLYRPQAANGKFIPRSQVPKKTSDTAPAEAFTGSRQTVKYLVREPQFEETPLTVVFKDSSGHIQGSYSYRECDTAEKLFDVACVARIAQIEPPATRLLKVEFEGGGDGCIRPDSASDYEKVFKAELKKLIDSVSSTAELKVTIRPYR